MNTGQLWLADTEVVQCLMSSARDDLYEDRDVFLSYFEGYAPSCCVSPITIGEIQCLEWFGTASIQAEVLDFLSHRPCLNITLGVAECCADMPPWDNAEGNQHNNRWQVAIAKHYGAALATLEPTIIEHASGIAIISP